MKRRSFHSLVYESLVFLGRHPLAAFLVIGLAVAGCFAPASEGEGLPAGEVEAAAPSEELTPAPNQEETPRAYEVRWEEREFTRIRSSCVGCHETLSRELGQPVRHHLTSAHFRSSVTCHECHGGDPTNEDEEASHSLDHGFLGKLTHDEMLERCGSCHEHEVDLFTFSLHGPEHEGVRRVTCIECHGSHDIGAGARPLEFSWAVTCADCHDLPAISDLPENLIAMLTAKDSLYTKMRELRRATYNEPFDPAVMEPFREIRQLSADLVHDTIVEDIGETLSKINSKTAALEEIVDQKATNNE